MAEQLTAEQRAERRKKRRELFERDEVDWTDAELLSELEGRYKPTEVPPCRVCGGKLSIQAIGSGPTVWGCSGLDENGKLTPGRRLADAHYSQSTFEDCRRGGDSAVIELIRRSRRSNG